MKGCEKMGIPEVVMLLLYGWSVLAGIVNHGKTQEKTVNAYAVTVGAIVGVCLLYWGGFFA